MVRQYTKMRDLIGSLAMLMRQRRQPIALVAEVLGISVQHLYRIISGERNPSLGLLCKWAELYDHRIDAVYVLSEARRDVTDA